MGFFECLTETMQYLVEGHGYPPGHGLCLSLINHLQNHCAQIIKGMAGGVVCILINYDWGSRLSLLTVVVTVVSRETSGPRGDER